MIVDISPSAGGGAYKNYLPRVSKSCAYQPGDNIGIWEEFTAGNSFSLPTNHWYHIFTGQGSDAGYNTQLALGMTTTNIAYRNRNSRTWSSWQTLLTSGNYTSYTVTKTGSGASGSWGINVTGSSASCTGNSATATALTTSAGSATQPIYFSGGKPVACTYTLGKSVPSNAVFTDTNTWRPLGTTADTACAGNDSRLSNARPASDVYAWAKASSKPSYSWDEITSKPSTFTPSTHDHNSIYYTKAQVDAADLALENGLSTLSTGKADYETGTWSPTISNSSVSCIEGKSPYVKIGSIVLLWAVVDVNTTNEFGVNGFPIHEKSILSACIFDIDTSDNYNSGKLIRDGSAYPVYFQCPTGCKRIFIIYSC